MRHLVAHHGRKSSVRFLRDGQDSRVDRDLSAWQTECVGLRTADDADLPFKVSRRRPGCGSQTFGYPDSLVNFGAAPRTCDVARTSW